MNTYTYQYLFQPWQVIDMQNDTVYTVEACNAEFALLEAARLPGLEYLGDLPIETKDAVVKLGSLYAVIGCPNLKGEYNHV